MISSENNPDHIFVTSTLRRSLGRWRMVAFVALGVALLAFSVRLVSEFKTPENYIALVKIDGVIATSPERMAVLEQLGENEQVKAVVVRINSPGGTTAGGEELYEGLSKLRAQKPVVAVISELGASAAYMGAIATDRIFARRLSLVGSIGVLIQHIDASGLLNTIGIDMQKVASGPLKAEPEINKPLAGKVRDSFQALVDDSFNWFVDIVAKRRGLSRQKTLELADGRIMNGRMALSAGLIDQIGGDGEAIDWLERQKVPSGLPVLEVYPPAPGDWQRFLQLVGQNAQNMLGFGLLPSNGSALDAMVSLWQVGNQAQ
ncbi:hypothetical protein MNBD_ALPHA12-710 [hydrothermal vent metagenome]|uniref:Peptidase S49 domain-containing protein n=1 Tax=hydrothermal vent metagenome TaxID=652676 RepID=A0A3B0U1P9_9ZZZZ